jgi:ABC-type antimicrobial peptide transport system permease subunit
MAATIRQVFASIDPRVPVTIDSLEARSRSGLGSRKLLLTLSVGFGGVALFLAAAGVYSLVAFLAERGRRDAAICLALGARPASLRRRTTLRGAMPAFIGVAVGLAAAVPVGRALRAQLFNAPAFDPAVLTIAGATVVLAAWIAASVPARRTTRVDPAAVLRGE